MPERAQQIFANFMALKRLGHAYSSETMKSHDYGLTPAQIEVLMTVDKLGPLTFKDLAQHLTLQPAAVTQLFDALADMGYLERKVCDDDRRTSNITVTQSGQDKLKEFEPHVQQRKQLIIEALTSEEIDEFIRLQQKVIEHMQEALRKLKEK